MKWSYSSSKTFLQCNRKWYFGWIVANIKSKDEFRSKIHVYRKLQNIQMLRGSVVDQVISTYVVPRINDNRTIDEDQAVDFAFRIMKDKLEFAKQKEYWNGDVPLSDNKFCALYEVEYDIELTEEIINEAYFDISLSLTNFFGSELYNEMLNNTRYMIAQRSFTTKYSGISIYGTPDLVMFYHKGRMPKIVDWKVERPEYKEHWLQLGLYGFVLSLIARTKPHRDFPKDNIDKMKDPGNYDLIEFQLLNNVTKNYKISKQDLVDIDNYIFTTSRRMKALTLDYEDIGYDINSVPTTRYPNNCSECKYKGICWENLPSLPIELELELRKDSETKKQKSLEAFF